MTVAVPEPAPVAHMICPACHPEPPAAGDEVTRWCGLTLPVVKGQASGDMERCAICSTAKSCATCGATQTRFGLVKVANRD